MIVPYPTPHFLNQVNFKTYSNDAESYGSDLLTLRFKLLASYQEYQYSLIMSHCHDEHDHHGHDHSEGAAHDHTDDLTPALQNHIYEQIDFSAINTLNETEPRSGSKVVQKTWTDRLDPEPELKSDADEQLLMHIPYIFSYIETQHMLIAS